MPCQNLYDWNRMKMYKFFKTFIEEVGDFYFGIDVDLEILVVGLCLTDPGFKINELIFRFFDELECLFIAN